VAARRLGSGPEWEEVPREVAVARLERLQAAQRRITSEALAARAGQRVEVLVEGPGDEEGGRLGRTPENHLVHLRAPAERAPAGALVAARVTRTGGNSLSAELDGG
jgi:tRNA-2-methylthio-N6-dimethylallyladenosine synthase